MANAEEELPRAAVGNQAWVQLSVRIPKALHHEVKLHCVQSDMPVMDFVVAAIRERLARVSAEL
jgi:hypothetical protein